MSKSSNRSKLTKRILIGIAVALVLMYIIFLFITTNFLGNDTIVTETAYNAKAYDIIDSKAMIVRDENYLQSSANGVLVYNVSDGDKVTADGVIATSYASQEDVAAIQQVKELDDKISFLETLNSVESSANVGIDTINSQISDRLTTVLKELNAKDYSNLAIAEENLLTSILRKQILTGEQGNIADKIEELKAERDAVKASCGSPTGTVKSGSAGYFVSKVDGYEKVFDLDKLDELTVSDVEDAEPAPIEPSDYIGKIINGVNWYLLCPITSDQATGLSHTDSSIRVRIPSVLTEEIPAKIVYVNSYADSDKTIAVLQCNYMNDALSKLRSENIEIIVNEYEGLKVSKSALHDDNITFTVKAEDGTKTERTERVQGVYIQYGAELVFRQVAIIYSGDDYVICDENPSDGVLLGGSTISLYDKIVVEGSDLFDGKLVQ